MSVSLNVARAWAEAAYTAGHREGVENHELPETFDIDNYRPKRGKRSSKGKKGVDKTLSSAEYNATCCDARVWNTGYGGQCSKSPFDGGHFCSIHQKQYDASLEKGGSDLRNGRYSQPIPERTLDGSDENIPWKSGDGPSISPKKDDVKHVRPRGPAPKSDSGGRKVWDGEVGVWVEPKVESGSDTEDMTDEETTAETPAVETVVAETVAAETVAVETVAEETVAEETAAVETVVEETVAEETVVEETAAVETVVEETVVEESDEEGEELNREGQLVETAPPSDEVIEDPVVFAGENFEPEPEPESVEGGETAPENFEPEPDAPPAKLAEDLELDEDGDLAPETPSSIDTPTMEGDILKYHGVDYMFDADDGMMYHCDSYDEVGKYDKMTKKITWKTKKCEISHKKDVISHKKAASDAK
jgi:hypothetical protein